MRGILAAYPRLSKGAMVAIGVAILAALTTIQPEAIYRAYLPALGRYQPRVKIGLAWSSTVCGDAALLALIQKGGSYHNWNPNPNSCPQQPKHFPMWRPATAGLWNKPGYSDYALFLNEPDGIPPDGDAISCSAASSYWLQFKAVCPNCRAIVLNVTRGQNTSYVSCWRETIKTWTGSYPTIAGYGVHAYGSLAEIKQQVEIFRAWMVATNQAGLELWLTEYGGMYANLPQLTQLTAAELENLLDWLETQAYLQRHFFFPPRFYKPGEPCNPCPNVFFVGATNNLTPLGQEFKEGGYPGPQAPPAPAIQFEEGYP